MLPSESQGSLPQPMIQRRCDLPPPRFAVHLPDRGLLPAVGPTTHRLDNHLRKRPPASPGQVTTPLEQWKPIDALKGIPKPTDVSGPSLRLGSRPPSLPGRGVHSVWCIFRQFVGVECHPELRIPLPRRAANRPRHQSVRTARRARQPPRPTADSPGPARPSPGAALPPPPGFRPSASLGIRPPMRANQDRNSPPALVATRRGTREAIPAAVPGAFPAGRLRSARASRPATPRKGAPRRSRAARVWVARLRAPRHGRSPRA